MSEVASSISQMAASAGLTELMRSLRLIAESVYTEPLTRADLMRRWKLTEEKTLQRWCEDLRLKPFQGRGKHALYRMSAVIAAEQRGEKLNGGSGE